MNTIRQVAVMLPELTQEEYSAALDAVAAEVLSALDLGAPPVDALALADACRLVVAWDDLQPGRGRVVRLQTGGRATPQGSILLRPDPRPERLQWAIVHEIGESFAWQVFDRLGIDPREAPAGARESTANHLAGRLLLPAEWFAEDGARLAWDLLALKARYATASHELIARRMLDFATGLVITIFDQGRRTFRRGTLAGRLPPLIPLEVAAWQTAHLEGRVADESDAHCRVIAWPVHEPGWKREILRSEWREEEQDF